jgi:hypothetical protein
VDVFPEMNYTMIIGKYSRISRISFLFFGERDLGPGGSEMDGEAGRVYDIIELHIFGEL